MPSDRAPVHRARMHARRAAVILCYAAFAAASVAAEPVHKCVGATTTYQSQPCAAGERDLIVQGAATLGTRFDGVGEATGDIPTPAAVRVDGRWQPIQRVPLAIGMTDDEALNAPDGGVPAHIARRRAPHTFSETWTYTLRDGRVRELTFVNGRLASAGIVLAPPLRVAALGG
jgi:hypothetical protein